MNVTHDLEADAAYIQIAHLIAARGVATAVPVDPVEVGGMINLDFDSEGHLVGIEILDARTHPSSEVAGSGG